MRKTKIVCTLGPASQSEKVLGGLIGAGMDMARLNFSHGTHESQAQVFRRLRRLAKKAGKPIPVLQDLQGPKIRTGLVQGGSAALRPRDSFILTTRKVLGTKSMASTTYPNLPHDVKAGDTILVGDGYLRLRVEIVKGFEVYTKVVEGGILKSHMGINLPGVDLSTPSLTRKDREDLAFGLSLGVDYVGMSFVRRAEDIETLKRAMARLGREVPVIAKLERPEAIANLSSILDKADGVMVARGDLGVEMPLAQVPIYQKEIIKQANQKKRLVITATQMLESMIENSKPTRAEVSDVANAIFDGTDAVMLSGETASGKYPVQAAATMAAIASTAESHPLFQARFEPGLSLRDPIPDAVAQAAVQAAERTGAKAIVAFSQSGMTALFVSKYRPSTPVIGFTPHEGVCRRMGLFWGVLPRIMRPISGTDRLIDEVEKNLLQGKQVKKGDRIVVLMGAPIYRKGTTNLLKIVKVGR
ncbi:MAG: pyruvate kinase [Deltaproteobacteria bacterium]|nr:pyruvate kinase [Deltaproteobacteria bacterium]